jgi:hypothetical protein
MIQGSVAIGGSGAVGTVTGSGVASVAKGTTGLYTITLSDAYARFLGLSAVVHAAVAGTASNVGAIAVDDNPQSSTVGVPGKKLKIQTLDFAGAKVDPQSGCVIYFVIWLRNSSIKGAGE